MNPAETHQQRTKSKFISQRYLESKLVLPLISIQTSNHEHKLERESASEKGHEKKKYLRDPYQVLY